MVVDLGTGDGGAVLRLARQRPDSLVIGVDSSAGGLIDASRKAAGKAALPNALFVVGDAAEVLPQLRGCAEEVRITLPWGSLLRRIIDGERAFSLAVAGAL